MKIIKARVVEKAPLADLPAAMAVATVVESRDGQLTRDLLAIALGNKRASGNANNKILAALRFGLIRRSPEGMYFITDLGRRCIVPEPRASDLQLAIRKNKPFARVIDALGWTISPEDHARIDPVLEGAGIERGAVVDARRVLLRSVAALKGEDAGILQGSAASAEDTETETDAQTPGDAPLEPRGRVRITMRSKNDPVPFVDIPAIKAILDAAPVQGSSWPAGQQDDFVEALRHFIRFAYPSQ